MTATIVDLKCPACGHRMGQEEYERVVVNFNRFVEEKYSGEIEQIRYESDMKCQHMKQEYERNVENQANEMAASKIREMELIHREDVKQETQFAVSKKQRELEEEKAGYKGHIQRLEKHNGELSLKIEGLTAKVEEQKKMLDNLSSVYQGDRGEIHLLDVLHSAFPDDELVPKVVGVEMADVIQTVVTENGKKVMPPIVWDRKTSDKVTPLDICKAKKYKTIHNTDYSIIVTEKGITKKDSNNRMFGERDGIKLVHPDAVVDMARIFRSVIIDKAKQTSSNKDRTSKEAKLYEYLKSSGYARTIEAARNAETKLDDLQRKEEKYHKDTWNERKKLMDERRNLSETNQQKINEIMLPEENKDSKDSDSVDKMEEDNSSSSH